MAQPAPLGRSPRNPVARGIVALLLLVAVGGALAVPLYARSRPKLGAFPFFYWYQLLWVPVVAIACWLSYLLLRSRPAAQASSRDGEGAAR